MISRSSSNRSTPSNRSTGFSLVELITGIAIIVIVLFAILLPALNKVKEVSDRVGCTANLRAIGGAIQMYVVDNGGVLPSNYTDRPEGEGRTAAVVWVEKVAEYAGYDYWLQLANSAEGTRNSIFACPAEDDFSAKPYYTYGLNFDLYYGQWGDDAALPYARIVNPARYALVADTFRRHHLPTSTTARLIDYGLTRRHKGKPTLLYADYHDGVLEQPVRGVRDGGPDHEFYLDLWRFDGTTY